MPMPIKPHLVITDNRNDENLFNSSERRIILEKSGVAPPPSRDFYRIRLTEDEFILTHWKISYGRKTPHPEDFRFPIADYHLHPKTISDVGRIFGKTIQQRVLRQAKSRSPLILGLPTHVLLRILYHTGIQDICSAGRTCTTIAKMKYIPAGQEPDKQTLTRVSYLGWKFLFFDNHICDNVFPGKCMTMQGYREKKKNLGIANWSMAVQRPHMMENRGLGKIVGGGLSTVTLSTTSTIQNEKNEKKRVEDEAKIYDSLRDILDQLKRRKTKISGSEIGSSTSTSTNITGGQQKVRKEGKEKTMESKHHHHHHKEKIGGIENKSLGMSIRGKVEADPAKTSKNTQKNPPENKLY